MKLAIFDFDGTIYKKETFGLLMEHLKTHPTYSPGYKNFYRSILLPYISYKLKIYPEEKMKANLMHKYLLTFNGLSETEINEYFAEVASKMENDLNQDVTSRLKSHAKDGLYVMIVSGAFTPLLKSVVKNLPVDKIIGTDIPLQHEMFDSSKHMDHVHASRKTELIQQWFQNKTVNWSDSYAYGDSFSDLSVLELVGNPIAVCPDNKLRTIAIEKAWEVIE